MIFKIQKIKVIREQRAQLNKTQKQQEKRVAEQALSDKKLALEQYMLWQENEINKKYQEILGKSLHMDDLSDFNYEISSYKTKQLSLEQEVEQAENQLREAITALDEANKAHIEARSKLEKFDELTQLEIIKQNKAASLLEDQALDEFVVKAAPSF